MTPHRVILGSHVCLSAENGKSNNDISKKAGDLPSDGHSVEACFEKLGQAGIVEDASHGRISRRTEKIVKMTINRTHQNYPFGDTY